MTIQAGAVTDAGIGFLLSFRNIHRYRYSLRQLLATPPANGRSPAEPDILSLLDCFSPISPRWTARRSKAFLELSIPSQPNTLNVRGEGPASEASRSRVQQHRIGSRARAALCGHAPPSRCDSDEGRWCFFARHRTASRAKRRAPRKTREAWDHLARIKLRREVRKGKISTYTRSGW